MKISNPQPDTLITVLIKLSFYYIFCLFVMNELNAKPLYTLSQSNTISTLRQKVKQIYSSQIGIREKQPNSGPVVEKYLGYVNLPKGNPWCAAFVCWIYGQAGVGNPKSGWSPDLFGEGRVIWSKGESRTKSQEPGPLQSEASPLYRYADTIRPTWQRATGNWHLKKVSGIKYQVSRPLPSVPGSYPISLTTNNEQRTTPSTGDIFGLFFPEKARIAHVGFIDQWDGTWLVSVEGNTNVSGGREGDGVYRKRRLVRSVYKVARYVE